MDVAANEETVTSSQGASVGVVWWARRFSADVGEHGSNTAVCERDTRRALLCITWRASPLCVNAQPAAATTHYSGPAGLPPYLDAERNGRAYYGSIRRGWRHSSTPLAIRPRHPAINQRFITIFAYGHAKIQTELCGTSSSALPALPCHSLRIAFSSGAPTAPPAGCSAGCTLPLPRGYAHQRWRAYMDAVGRAATYGLFGEGRQDVFSCCATAFGDAGRGSGLPVCGRSSPPANISLPFISGWAYWPACGRARLCLAWRARRGGAAASPAPGICGWWCVPRGSWRCCAGDSDMNFCAGDGAMLQRRPRCASSLAPAAASRHPA